MGDSAPGSRDNKSRTKCIEKNMMRASQTVNRLICGGSVGPGPTKHRRCQCKTGGMISYSHIAHCLSVFQHANDQRKQTRHEGMAYCWHLLPSLPTMQSTLNCGPSTGSFPLWVFGSLSLKALRVRGCHILISVFGTIYCSVLTSCAASLLGQVALVK